MQIRRGFLGWGVFLILAGAIPLLVRSGYLDADQVGRLWQLWPLILVGIGVGLILRHTRFDVVGGLIVAATVGLMVGGVLAVGVGTISTGFCGSDDGSVAFPSRDGTLAGSAAVQIQLDCGQMTVGVAPGSAWRVAGTDADGIGPTIDSTDGSLSVRSRAGRGAPFFGFGARDTWQIAIPDASTMDVELRVDAGSATVDLGGASLGALDVQQDAGSATVDLGEVKAIGGLDARLKRRIARPDPAEHVGVRNDRGQRWFGPVVRTPGSSPQAADRREYRRQLRLRRPRPRQGRFDLDDPGLRYRGGQDRIADVGECRLVHPRSGGRM
jgi:hypothetical protein